jgi:hypothetical protein
MEAVHVHAPAAAPADALLEPLREAPIEGMKLDDRSGDADGATLRDASGDALGEGKLEELREALRIGVVDADARTECEAQRVGLERPVAVCNALKLTPPLRKGDALPVRAPLSDGARGVAEPPLRPWPTKDGDTDGDLKRLALTRALELVLREDDTMAVALREANDDGLAERVVEGAGERESDAVAVLLRDSRGLPLPPTPLELTRGDCERAAVTTALDEDVVLPRGDARSVALGLRVTVAPPLAATLVLGRMLLETLLLAAPLRDAAEGDAKRLLTAERVANALDFADRDAADERDERSAPAPAIARRPPPPRRPASGALVCEEPAAGEPSTKPMPRAIAQRASAATSPSLARRGR